ncbi:MAG: radical SAM protein [Candidatus Caldatribacteriaceae bacterium]
MKGEKASLDFQWHITNCCNLRCRHCYQDTFGDKEDVLFAVAERLLRGLTQLGRSSVLNITGGEPLLFGEKFFRLLELLDRHPAVLELMCITNGLFLSKEMVKTLAAFRKLTTLKVSLEGMEKTNDAIRGKGVFRKVLQSLEFLRESPLRVVLMMTLHRDNLSDVPEFFRLAQSLEVDGVIFERFVPEGRGKEMVSSVLGASEWKSFVQELLSFCGVEIPLLSLLPYKAFWVEFGEEINLLGAPCSLGESFCLMPDGTVLPCRRLTIPLGNILKEDLASLVAHPILFQLQNRQFLSGKCRTCTMAECLGCRALAYAVSGNPFGEDVQCFFQDVRISTTSLS